MLAFGAKRQKLDQHDQATQTDDPGEIIPLANQEEKTISLFLEKIKTSIVKKMGYEKSPLIFISYAWKPDHDPLAQDKHNQRVTRLVKILEALDFRVIYDRNDLMGDIPSWMELGVKGANKVIIIGTPELYTKITEGRNAGPQDKKPNVYIEFTATMCRKEEDRFPILFEGDRHSSFPAEMHQQMIMDCSTEEKFLPGLLSAENPLGLLPALLNLKPSAIDEHQALRTLYVAAWDELKAKLIAQQSPYPQATHTLLHAQSTSHLLHQWQQQLQPALPANGVARTMRRNSV